MNKLYMMIGLPASGKSTIAKELSISEEAIIVSSDEIRKELLGDINDQSQNARVFEEVEKRIKEGLLKGNVIYDATNINYKKRRAFLQKINKMEIQKIAVLVATPYEQCLIRNAKRERKVPEEVIKRMYYNFYIPQYYEGFDEIKVTYNSDKIFFYESLKDMNQDNPHHKYTVLKHCKRVEEFLEDNNVLRIVGRLHDIGKLKTKTFINAKGEKTDIAHYYSHEKVGAYDSLFYISIRMKLEMDSEIKKNEALYILNLIQWHMLLHFALSEKSITKYKSMLGEDTWRDLNLLHEADCEAR